jgi:hypothetical protein
MRKKAVILGTGESAKHYKQDLFDFVLGINDAVKLGYKLDAICFVDKWKRVVNTRPEVLNTDKFTEKICKYGDCPLPYSKQIESVKHVMNGSFTVDRKPISHGASSALYAVCICTYYGYKEIELYGIDLITHEAMSAEFIRKGIDINKVPTLSESGFKDARKWASKYSLHNSILELVLVRKFLKGKGIKMSLTKDSPISKIVNND